MISIIVPVYNSEKYLIRCIESILHQSIESIEIILIDDGSMDKSDEICDKYSGEYSNIKVIHKENGGSTSARLAGVEAATYDLIGFVDSDDYVEPEMFAELYKMYSETGADLISSGTIRDYDTGRKNEIIMDNYPERLYRDIENSIYPSMLFDFNNNNFGIYPTLWNKLFKKNIIKKILEEIDRRVFYGEDALTIYSYCMEAKSIYILHKAYYHYCIRNDSMCHDCNPELIMNTYRLYATLHEKFKGSSKKNELIRQLKRYVLELESHTLESIYGINHGLLNIWEFNYDSQLLQENKFIIYGANACGQALFHYVRRNDLQDNLVAWVDKNYEQLEFQCDYELESINNGLSKDYDLIIIAVKNSSLADVIRDELITNYHVEPNKIIWEECIEKSFFSEAML
ncbi:glycosyltransferase family 2 protein [Pseudobutyrivibrio sp. LB2011]|uniref:glycosyltransferase family 2 protein n=1 Tax=Pseudobutyrivibrio sp. LB2011 TaxID=1408312 RepID=UPI000679422F|nr:glycosyltransferase family 2 protein [Pseudobutyrivibrio sp. LB2011]